MEDAFKLIEYRCEECGNSFDVEVAILAPGENPWEAEGTDTSCPACFGEETEEA